MGRPNFDADQVKRVSFYATPDHECPYLDGRRAVTLFADPYAQLNNQIYTKLAQYGFRRSGRHIYRPACPSCSSCIPVRIQASAFKPNRSQRRTRQRNQDISVQISQPDYNDEQHRLYIKYISTRHPGGGMDVPEPDKYMDFLVADWTETEFVEFRLAGKLVAVAVIDLFENGMSAVYTFYDPDLDRRSLGTLAILWQIEACVSRGLPWLYLGYWIPECQKMQYKQQFKPMQHFHNGVWHDSENLPDSAQAGLSPGQPASHTPG